MARLRFAVVFGVLCIALALLAMGMTYKAVDIRPVVGTKAGSIVKVLMGNGHGSAVNIGNGALVTAAHVVPKDAKSLKIRLDNGTEREADVFWRNEAYDIALLRLRDTAGIHTRNLACRVPSIGEAVTARGNPLTMEWITTWGTVSGVPMKAGPWSSVIPVNIAIAGGMSGGALLDANGDLIGIIVGVPVQPLGFSGTFVGIGYIVPGDVVCNLLARA